MFEEFSAHIASSSVGRLVHFRLQTSLVNKHSSHVRQSLGFVHLTRCIPPLGMRQLAWLPIRLWKFLGRRLIYLDLV